MLDLSIRFVNDGYWLGPGSLTFDEPFYSFEVDEIAEYSPESIVAAILAVAGTREVHSASTSLWNWEAVWESGDRRIFMDDMYLSEETGSWMQLRLICDCQLGDVLALWESVRALHPAVWIYGDDSRVYSPASFIAKHAEPRIAHDRPGT